MKLLTITVPCYNSAAYMENCLNSLIPGGERIEIIIIDDGSKDETGAIADSWAEKYPTIVRVVHQENGGHGEGINQGIRHATGKYFKTVDSDDTLSEDFIPFLDALEAADKAGEPDLFITNYRYVHADGKGDRSISFAHCLPKNRLFTWDETKAFRVDEVMMIHSCTWKTELLRKNGVELPKHMFYEDNYFVYSNLARSQKYYYMDIDLYRYFIGRADQSMQEASIKKRYTHQLKAVELCFRSVHLDEVQPKQMRNYLKHELFILFGGAIFFARLVKTDAADGELDKMWAGCREFDAKWADYFRNKTLLWFLGRPGKAGRGFTNFVYRFSHLFVRFN